MQKLVIAVVAVVVALVGAGTSWSADVRGKAPGSAAWDRAAPAPWKSSARVEAKRPMPWLSGWRAER